MAGTDHPGSELAARTAKTLAHLFWSLNLDIDEGGAGLNGSLEFRLSLLPGTIAVSRYPASGDQRRIRGRKQLRNLFFIQRAPVKANLSHLYGRVIMVKKIEYLLKGAVLYGYADHAYSCRSLVASPGVMSLTLTSPIPEGKIK